MDKHVIALFIPMLGMMIPVLGIVMVGVLKLQKNKLEMLRLQGQADPGLLNELDDLRGEVHQLRGELTEVQERLDFTERLLASRGDRQQLPGA